MITLNGTPVPQQPSSANENPEKVKTDTFSINKTMQRNQGTSKKTSSFVIPMARSETVQFITDLYDAAQPVTYFNDKSNKPGGTHTFTGILDYEESDYIRGGSLMVSLSVSIREE